MTKQITFLIDEDTKRKAQIKAKNEGLSLKSVLVFSLKAYSEGKIQFGMINDDLEYERVEIEDRKLMKKVNKIEDLIQELEKNGKLPKGSVSEQLRRS